MSGGSYDYFCFKINEFGYNEGVHDGIALKPEPK